MPMIIKDLFNRRVIIRLGLSFVFLLCGLLIYLATRSGTYVNDIFHFISLPQIVPDTVFKTVVFSWGADFLWVVAFTLALSCFVERAVTAPIIVAGLGILFELFQLFGVTTGTFDIFDIFVEALAAVLVFVGIMFLDKKNR
ncbi:MAG: hypothetical protein J6Q83_06185 [Clostridia bacterium]|nr:hypothetical protein [Clostridia bacterium]